MEDALEAARRFVELVFKQSYGEGNFGSTEFWDALGALVPMAQANRQLPAGAVASLREASLRFMIRPGAPLSTIKANLERALGETLIDEASFKLVIEWLRTQVNGSFETVDPKVAERKKRMGGEF